MNESNHRSLVGIHGMLYAPPDKYSEIGGVTQQRDKKVAEVIAEGVVFNGKKMIKIIGFSSIVEFLDLPSEYINESPRFSMSQDPPIMIVVDNVDNFYHLSPGKCYMPDKFEHIITTMKQAGVRLTAINKKLKLEKEHSGTFTVKI